jgi:EAL domain-containing protein (putative c-di-GMP-specific phosphodiesterase class I)/FixJ family two-component response regulator
MSVRLAYVLDDEPKVGAFVCQVFTVSGFAAQQFSAPTPFFIQVKVAPPEVIVLDLALGQSDAVEVIRQLDTLKYSGKVLLISGRDEAVLHEIERIGRSHGLAMLPSLHKPFRVADLRERLHAMAAGAEVADAKKAIAPEKKIAIDLEEALRNNWLELWYQPKVDLKSLSVNGAEALLRARHPGHGIVLPADLLPASGDPLYQPLTRFVIERAIKDWYAFADHGLPLKLAINVPASVLHAPDFLSIVRQLLPRDARFPGLIIELTEDDVIRDADWVCELATQLKLYNIGISIDDFGNAYSSLARLRDLPCVEIKLDIGFVAGCANDETKKALCQTVIELAHRFKVLCCAEGVEKAEDLLTLVGLGCDMAQGFLFSKPQPREDFIKALLTRQSKTAAEPAGAALAHSA